MSENKNQFVLPGDTISGSYEPAQNVILDDNRLLSTAIGFCEIDDNQASVSPLTGFYIPKSDDLVIGKIKSHTSMVWEVDINSYHVGILPAFDIFGKDYNPSKDDQVHRQRRGDFIRNLYNYSYMFHQNLSGKGGVTTTDSSTLFAGSFNEIFQKAMSDTTTWWRARTAPTSKL